MRKTGKLMILLGIFALLIGGTLVARKLTVKKEAAAEEQPEKETVFCLNPEEVTDLSCTMNGETLSFTKTDGKWTMTDTPEFPLNQERIEEMLSALEEVKAEKTLEKTAELSEYGLEEPVCSITADGKQLLIGNEQELDGYRYVSTDLGDVCLTDPSLLDAFQYGKEDLIQNETIPDMADISSFKVETPEGSFEIVHRENSGLAYSDEYEYFVKDGTAYIPLSTELARDFMENITYLNWNSCVDWNADDDLLNNSGLTEPEITVTVDYSETSSRETGLKDSDGNPVSETVETPREFVLEISGSYGRIRDSRMVYRIGEGLADKLTYTTAYELMPEEVLALDFSDVISMDISFDGKTVTLDKNAETETDPEGNTTIAINWTCDGQKVEVASLTEALDEMQSCGNAARFTTDGDTELTLKLYRSNATYPVTELSFHRYDSINSIASIDGQPTVLVQRTDVVNLKDLIQNLAAEPEK